MLDPEIVKSPGYLSMPFSHVPANLRTWLRSPHLRHSSLKKRDNCCVISCGKNTNETPFSLNVDVIKLSDPDNVRHLVRHLARHSSREMARRMKSDVRNSPDAMLIETGKIEMEKDFNVYCF